MIQINVLKHKTLPDTFGHLVDSADPKVLEIAHSRLPQLNPTSCTMEVLKDFLINKEGMTDIKQLDDYDMITMELRPIIAPIDVAAGLLNIHHHSQLDEQGNCDTIYKESELLELLKSWGIAKPDWEGHEKRLMDIENALIERINKQP